MADDPNVPGQLKAALLGLRKLKARVAELESARQAPIAVVGVGCRFPGGATGPESFWAQLLAGTDAVGPVPSDRWDLSTWLGEAAARAPGLRHGGFLDDVYGFDADAFHISPREARAMDPQQRLLLEVSWEALEHAGLIARVEGSQTGVFLGVALTDWEQRTLRHPDPDAMDLYAGTGSFNSVAAGRISYALGLRGPSVALDTACSSSLVAIHLACQSLRSGECSVALAGGANLLLSPDPTLYFSRMGALAPDGRCKTFDAAADGYVRSEGVGVVVLKRLDDALRDGDRVLAVVRGSAVNQDGRSNGLTAPNPDAQRAVLRAALANAGVSAAEVGLVETHGTGTPLGDPIEVDALRAVYGEGQAPLVLGAAKSQFGHAEAAAGILGFVKAVQAVRHGQIPANLHLHTPNPRLNLTGSRLTLPRVTAPWAGPRVAAVSGFGMSGTNAHVVLSEAPAVVSTTAPRAVRVLTLSGRDEATLAALSEPVRRALETAPWADACATASSGRVAARVRRAIVAASADEAIAALGRGDGVVGEVGAAGRVGLVLGSVDAGTVAAIRAEETAFGPIVDRLMTGLQAAEDDARGIVALVALAELLASWGVHAHAVSGVGEGRWAAGVIAGVLPLDVAIAASRTYGDGRRAVLSAARFGEARCYVGTTRGALVASGLDSVDAWMDDAGDGSTAAMVAEGLALVSVGAAVDGALPAVGGTIDGALPAVRAAVDGALPAVGADLPRVWANLLAALWVRGVPVDWRAWQPGRVVDWPTTPFRHTRYFLDDPMEAQRAAAHRDARVWATVERAVDLPRAAPRRWCVVSAGPNGVTLAAAIGATLEPSRGVDVVDATALDRADAGATLALAQRVVSVGARLHVVVPDVSADADVGAVRGLAAVFGTELSAAWGGLLVVGDLDAHAIADVLQRADGRDLRRAADGLVERRLEHATLGPATWTPRADGTWWLTGGLGELGLRVAGWLVALGVTRLVLTARRGPGADANAQIDAWRARGVDVRVALADVSSADDVARIRGSISDLRGLIHLAGVVDDAPFVSMDAARLAAVLAPKQQGTQHLDAVTRDADLDAFVVMGSASATLGVFGQAAYAAANEAAAAVVEARVRAGFPGLCAVFGPWDAGMADAAVRRRLEAMGVQPLATDEALSLLGRALAQPGSARLFLRLDAARYASSTGSPRVAHLLGQPLATHAAAAPVVERASWRVALTRALAQVLGSDGDPDPTRGLFELGLDSMTAVAFAARVEHVIGRAVPPTLAFDHGTLDGVIAWAEGDASPAAIDAPRAPTDEPVAIVGMAMRFPGGANDPEAFWKLLVDGVDAIGPVPPSRWSADALYDPNPGAPGKVIVREGAFLDDVASFDAEFFGIAPREALSLDPQQRLLLEVGVEALERAAIPLDGLLRRSVGVFVGIGPSDYGRRFDALHGEPDLYAGTGNEASFAAGRLAYALGVQGPAIGLNTACSTSLVTTHLACQALRAGECELALAGGVNLMLSPESTVQLSALSALSPNGRCRTFDADADGYARGEGCGVVVFKRLSDAVRDGDPILAVIRASMVNHDGPSAGLTVPSGDAQARLLTTTLARAGLRGEDVGFLEAHGTGTRLGDPIEVGAVSRAYGARPADRPLVMSSVKTHIGHLELAAGVAGLASAVLSIRHRRFAPHLHLKVVNPALDLSFPVRIPTTSSEWTSDRLRVASVSSFGLSGTNANVLVEEAPELPVGHDDGRRWQVLRLSANSSEVLRAYAARLADTLDGSDLRLDDVANTLRTGRTARRVRVAVVASTVAEAVDQLRRIAGTLDGGRVWTLARGAHALVIATSDGERRFAELVASWFGAGVPDEALSVSPRRIELPSTPWQHTRFWVPRVADEGEATVPGAAHLHRLTWVAHATRANVSGPWTLIADRGGVALSVAEALRARGQQVSLVDALGVATGCVVDLRPCDGGDTIADASLHGAFDLVRPVSARQGRLWVLTSGVSEGRALPSAGLVGLMRGMARELPAATGGWIDVVDVDSARIADALLDGETQLRVRAGVVERPSLVHDEGRPIDHTHGTWWITGGLGALGLHVARALVALGAERLVLTGRTGPKVDVAAALDRLRAEVAIDVRLADVTDADAVAAIADELGASLVGVVHAAGALSDATLRDSDWARFSAPLPTKWLGAWNLHRATLGLSLEHFVLFSSAAGTFGWTGQAGYAAANTALDALALYRRAKGLPATSVAFGPWSGAGMADARVADAMASVGMRALSPPDALGALRRALGGGHATWVALDLDATTWARSQPGSASLVSSLLPVEAAASTSPLARLPLRERTERVVEAVRATVASALGHEDGAALDGSRGLFDMGLDSLMAVQVSRGLARRTDLVVPDTIAFDQPSIDALVAWVLAQLADAVTLDDAPAAAGGDEPIAVVGMGLRMPGGVADPDAFWSLLADGRDAIVPVPAERWDVAAWFDPEPGVPGRLYVREGGFLGDVAGFEPGVFGISPKEASRLDPQQRLLLECTWEALERAGVAPDSLRDTATAVFVGIGGHDYERVIERAGPADADDAYTGTGNDPAFAAGRISYVLGARGPALSLNTACSSSLVAAHLGVRSLRAGESSLALVGGVRLMLSPEETLRLSALRALSPGSRCRTFDADADGYVRGEGCGVLVLERLSDARRHGHPVLAVIAGSAVNHDGASGGLTVPSGSAQASLLRGALADAGLRGDDVDVLEAHGTGTPLGDPIELNAVGSVFGDRPGARPLIVGSVKTNVGHLELAAGVAGLIKAVLSLQHDAVPASLHFQSWNPRASRDFPVTVPTHTTPWPRDHRRVAGVSAFGLSGTNAHVLLADASDRPPERAPTVGAQPIVVSSRTADGLAASVGALASWLDAHPDAALSDVAWTLAVGRARQAHRRVVVASTAAEAAAALRAEAGHAGALYGGAVAPRTAFLFTGQGAQSAGMMRGLYDRFPVFRDVVDRCDVAMRSLRGEGLLPVLFPTASSPIGETAWTQPALYAVEVATAALWQSAGVSPSLLIGHSVGELAAATVAGLWSIEDGLAVVEARGRLMQSLPRDGAMAAIGADEATVRAAIALDQDVEIAALNAPEETVISGDVAAVDTLVAEFAGRGVRAARLEVSHAFHSRRMEPIFDAFEAVVRATRRQTPQLPVLSNLTGEPEREALVDPNYWVRHIREAVRFAPAIRRAVAERVTVFVEVGPHPVLTTAGARVASDPSLIWLSSARRGQADVATLLDAMARHHAVVGDVSWRVLAGGTAPQILPLPTIAWQRTRHWIGGAASPAVPSAPTLVWRWTTASPSTPASGPVWVRGAGAWTDEAATALSARGVTVLRGDAPPADARVGRVVWVVEPTDPHATLADRLRASLTPLLAWLARPDVASGHAPIVWLTGVADSDPVSTAVGALARVVGLEQRGRYGGVVERVGDVDPATLADALLDPAEDRQRVEGATRQVARLAPAPAATSTKLTGAVLITGGLGAVGLAIATRLVTDGAKVVVLNARRAPGPDALTVIDALRARGARVEVVLGDVSDAADARRVVDAAGAFEQTLGAVIHAAGLVDDANLAALDWSRVAPSLAAKVDGALNLANATSDAVRLVFVSSATAWLGAHGQGAYAIANGALDGLAGALRAQGRDATSVAFGPWSGAGMAARHADEMTRRGIRLLAPTAAVEALTRAWSGGPASVAVADADWSIYRRVFDGGAARAMLDVLAPPVVQSAPAAPSVAPSLKADQVRAIVRAAVAKVLGFDDASRVDAEVGFFELGLDSLMTVALADQVARQVGVPLSPGATLDHPTVTRLTAHVVARLGGPAAAAPVILRAPTQEPIAIVGMACRFPGAPDVDAFWDLLVNGRSAVGEAPRSRWPDFDALYDPTPGARGKTYTRAGAFLDDIAGFDPLFFGLSPREAEAMDPQQRLMLEVAWEAMEDAAVGLGPLAQSRTGVFVGMGASEYDARFAHPDGSPSDAYAGTGNDTSFAAGRIAFHLGVRGPAMTVNTACSASLVALHLACQALRAGECELAIAGGVNLMVAPESHVRLAALRALSPTGLVHAFDAAADGYVRGEGAGAVMVARLSDAKARGLRVLAIVRGSGVNHDGPSSALTVPSGPAQTELLRETWARAGVTPDDLGYVEAHGTGTRLGDPIELTALAAALDGRTRPLPVGSVKTNVGHLELAAGAAGLIKAVLALQHGLIPAHLNYATRNPLIPADLPITIPTSTTPWSGARVAGVSSFGLSGTNAHVVIEGVETLAPTDAQGIAAVIPLAARTQQSLTALASDVADVAMTVSLADLSRTALAGRASGVFRLAVVGEDAAAIAPSLRGESRDGRFEGETPTEPPKMAWVFSGQGALGGAAELLRNDPGFAEAIDALDRDLAFELGGSLRAALASGQGVERPELAAAALTAFQVAIAARLEAWGLRPDVVLGHGVGEIAAAVSARVLSGVDAVRFAAARARALDATAPGRMVALRVGEAAVRAAIGGRADVDVAAVNGAEAVVLSGSEAGVAAVVAALGAVDAIPLPDLRGLHSPLVAPALDALRAAAGRARLSPAIRPLVVSALGQVDAMALATPDGWATSARSTVRFSASLATAVDLGATLLVEIGPQPQLLGMVRRAIDARGRVLVGVHRSDRGWATLLESLAHLWVRGAAVEWEQVPRPLGGRRVAIPTTPFNRRRTWIEA